HRSGEDGPEERLHEIDAGGKDEGDPVRRLDSESGDPGRGARRAHLQLREGEVGLRLPRVDESERVGRSGGARDQLHECPAAQGRKGRTAQHQLPPALCATRAASSATVRTREASSSASATRKRSSRPTTSVSRPTESSCRSLTRSSPGFTSRESPSSSRRTRAISVATSDGSGTAQTQGGLLGPDPQSEERRVQGREDDGGQAGAVHGGQGDDLHGDREIVGLAEEAVGPALDRHPPGHHDDAHVPSIAERRDGPVAQSLREQEGSEGDPPQSAREGTVQDDDLEGAGTEEGGVEECHCRKMSPPVLDPTPRQRLPGVASRETKLRDPLASDERDQKQIGAGRRHHRRSTSSEQKPGPMATSNPRSPPFASPESSRSRSTNRTEAEERFPTERSDSQVRASASAGSSSASSNASSTRGPPV